MYSPSKKSNVLELVSTIVVVIIIIVDGVVTVVGVIDVDVIPSFIVKWSHKRRCSTYVTLVAAKRKGNDEKRIRWTRNTLHLNEWTHIHNKTVSDMKSGRDLLLICSISTCVFHDEEQMRRRKTHWNWGKISHLKSSSVRVHVFSKYWQKSIIEMLICEDYVGSEMVIEVKMRKEIYFRSKKKKFLKMIAKEKVLKWVLECVICQRFICICTYTLSVCVRSEVDVINRERWQRRIFTFRLNEKNKNTWRKKCQRKWKRWKTMRWKIRWYDYY